MADPFPPSSQGSGLTGCNRQAPAPRARSEGLRCRRAGRSGSASQPGYVTAESVYMAGSPRTNRGSGKSAAAAARRTAPGPVCQTRRAACARRACRHSCKHSRCFLAESRNFPGALTFSTRRGPRRADPRAHGYGSRSNSWRAGQGRAGLPETLRERPPRGYLGPPPPSRRSPLARRPLAPLPREGEAQPQGAFISPRRRGRPPAKQPPAPHRRNLSSGRGRPSGRESSSGPVLRAKEPGPAAGTARLQPALEEHHRRRGAGAAGRRLSRPRRATGRPA